MMRSKYLLRELLTCFAMLFPVWGYTQSLEFERNKIFEHVDLTQVPYGILEDYGLSPVSLLPYTKRQLDTTNYLNYVTLQQVMLGLNSSLVPARQSDSIDIDRVNSLNEEYYSKGVIPITMLRYDLCRFAKEAVRRGDVYPENKQIRVKSPLSTSPYERLELFAASTFTSELDSRDVTFCIPKHLMLSNSRRPIAKVEIQFDGGQPFRPIVIGEQVTYRYATDGLKMVTLRVQQSGSSRWYRSHFPISIISQRDTKIAVDIPEAEIVFIFPDMYRHSGGALQYKLSPHNHTGKFRKPLLIVEGFDLHPTVPLIPNTDINNAFGYDNRAVARLNRLLDLGYDVVYLDYGDGMDDIRRNAELFREALQYINTHKEGDEENVVVGLSMGGLVASYGLRKMELDGEDHQTRKYISYDSPHMGANVPLGALYMAYHWLYGFEFSKIRRATNIILWFKDIPISMRKIRNWLDKPAVQQLLPFNSTAYFFFLKMRDPYNRSFHNPYDNIYDVPSTPNPRFALFHQEYQKMGLPRKTFNIAFSNGAIGVSPIAPRGSHLAEASGYAHSLLGIAPGIIASLFNNGGPHLNSFPLTSSTFTVHAYLNAMPCLDPYYQDIALTKHYLFGLLSYTYHLSRMQVRTQSPDPLLNDVVAGGIYSISLDTDKPLVDWELLGSLEPNSKKFVSWFLSSEFSARLNADKFCFVPLNSSLGIPAGEGVASPEEAKRKSPFDLVYTVDGTKSEQHISFGGHFNDFLLALKQDIPKDYRPQLDTTATICDCGTALQVLNPIEGLTYEWHTSMTLEALNYNRGIRTTVTPKRDLATNQPQGDERKWPLDQGVVYVDAYLNGRKFSTSDTCYVYIGRPDIKASTIAQLEVENGYQGRYLPYPTVQIDWTRWGNITGVEWDKAPLTATSPHQGFIIKDIDFVQQDLDQEAYEAVSSPSMIRYELQTQSGVTDWSDKLIGPDGKPISPKIDFEEPPIFKEARRIPSRTLSLNYIPSHTLFDEPGEYTLTYRLVNECGKSAPKKFTYHFMDQPILLSVTPTIVTDVDAVLRYGLVSSTGLELRPMPKDFEVSYVRYPYGIWSATGVLQHMGETRVGEPLGVIKLPPGQYVIKVWYENAYKEFHVIRQ